MASDFIDNSLQTLVQGGFGPHFLEMRRGEIVEKFVRCKQEQLEKAIPDLMGTTSNKITPASADKASPDQEIRELAELEQRRTQRECMGAEGEEVASEPMSHPEVDEKLSTDNTHSEGLHSESPCFMSICLPNGKWGGAALKYCKKEKSYVSLKIIERHKLGREVSVDGRVRLTWRLDGEEETNVTQFTVFEGLKCDFMLGTQHLDDEFNREDSSSRSKQVLRADGVPTAADVFAAWQSESRPTRIREACWCGQC